MYLTYIIYTIYNKYNKIIYNMIDNYKWWNIKYIIYICGYGDIKIPTDKIK